MVFYVYNKYYTKQNKSPVVFMTRSPELANSAANAYDNMDSSNYKHPYAVARMVLN